MGKKKKKKNKIWRGVKNFSIGVGVFVGGIVLGGVIFNFIALPLWVGKYQEVSTPDVCGKEFEKAKEILKSYGLRAKLKAERFSKAPKGVVVSQYPLPRRKIKKGRIVELCISRGEEKVQVPWVEGLTLEQGENLLNNIGLKVREIIYEYSEEIESNRIIRSYPPSDSFVPRGTEVTLYISEGGVTFLLPDFTGKTLREAQWEAQRIGVILEVKYIVKPSPLGIIVAQTPLPGTPVMSGEHINVIVGLPR